LTFLNLCTTCKADFASVSAFDKHRVGKHAYTYLEGIKMDPPREDGRRCLDSDEMLERGMELDSRGRWAIVADGARLRAWAKAA
jgi:hypothetical protein